MKRNQVNLRNLASIVNLIVNLHLVIRWVLHRKLLVDHTKIVINKFAFLIFFLILLIC